ncbi:DinB family protein [Parafilimonas terrae]|uniref:DinB superfamily protein n=1 Tax=Parafilimonas terrae TaxID=1465490 RepID=A0A1I5Z7E1_9BACT|nr:DinB family protein [Parafilimonas terrae]SFQ52389.1 DinB superfamily protein [Parafilimonas terrae]
MKTHNTQELIELLEEQTESILNIAVQQWQMMPSPVFKQQPSQGSWSAMQCLGHLNAYGRYYLPAIERAIDMARLKHQPAAEIFTPGWLGNYFTKLMLPGENGTAVKKMKAPKGYTITNEGNSDEIIATFINQQETLLLLLQQARYVNLNKIRIPVSIAKFIKLKLGDVFMFLIAHNLRHVKQAERAVNTAMNILIKKDERDLNQVLANVGL